MLRLTQTQSAPAPGHTGLRRRSLHLRLVTQAAHELSHAQHGALWTGRTQCTEWTVCIELTGTGGSDADGNVYVDAQTQTHWE